MLQHMPSFLLAILPRLQNAPPEASEKCGDGRIRKGRGGKEQQWSSLISVLIPLFFLRLILKFTRPLLLVDFTNFLSTK